MEGENTENTNHETHHDAIPSVSPIVPRIDNNPDKAFDKFVGKVKKNPWMGSTIGLGVLCLVLLIVSFSGGMTGNAISESDMENLALDFFNTKLSQSPGTFESIEEVSGVYAVNVAYDGQTVPLYFTKDGNWIAQGGELMPISDEKPSNAGSDTNPDAGSDAPAPDVVKSDKPKVELFVMTHCPYGTQAEKGMVPVLDLLGDKIDGDIKFVHYFMHEGPGEEPDETPIQVCLREEQSDKYLDYLTCFLEDGSSERCLDATGGNKGLLNSCVENKAADYYATDSEESQAAGVRGSPTLVINDAIVQAGRDSASYLQAVCAAFNDAPSECEEVLSSASPSPGFGGGSASGSNSAAQCG